MPLALARPSALDAPPRLKPGAGPFLFFGGPSPVGLGASVGAGVSLASDGLSAEDDCFTSGSASSMTTSGVDVCEISDLGSDGGGLGAKTASLSDDSLRTTIFVLFLLFSLRLDGCGVLAMVDDVLDMAKGTGQRHWRCS